MKFERHKLDERREEDLVRGRDRFITQLVAGHVCDPNLNYVRKPCNIMSSMPFEAALRSRIPDYIAVWQTLDIYCDLATSAFGRWFQEGEVDAVFAGVTLRVSGYKPNSFHNNPQNWWPALAISRLLRREKAITSLLDYDPAHFFKGGARPYRHTMARTYATATFWSNVGDFETPAKEAESSWEQSTVSPRVARLDLSVLPAMEALRSSDTVAFNKAGLARLKAFKAFWGAGKNKADPEGYLDYELSALCAVAFDQGMPIEIESDYIPPWLYEGPPPDVQAVLPSYQYAAANGLQP